LLENVPAGRPGRRFLQLRGVDDVAVAAQVHAVTLQPGGAWFSGAGVQELPAGNGAKSTAYQAVLGEGIAREMARDRTPAQLAKAHNPTRLEVGDTFSLGDQTWIVTGIMQSVGSTFDSEVWAKRSIVASLFSKDTYSTIVARTDGPESARKLKDFFNSSYKKASLHAEVETEYFASLSETNRQILVAVVFVTIFMAIGGVFGVINTMFAAISQRTADIGVLRILGFARWQILVSFLLESVLIALVGGALGCALGMVADGWTANSIVGGHGGGKFVVVRLAVNLNTLGVGMLVALLMGVAGGIVPAALSVLRLKPLEALR
jgi:putative ABC transport system permease protein